jgi:iron(III) transport system ATP-binding protein
VSTAALACHELTRRFVDKPAVDDVTFAVPEGQVLALLGPSGCGKTTTLRMLAGLERPDEGRVVIAGREVAGPGVFVPPERRGVGLVFQSYALFPHLSVVENVAFGLGRQPERHARAHALLEQVSLGHKASARVHELSGGEQQRVALARALAPAPAALLLDEPFANLDPSLRAEVREQVAQLLRSIATSTVLVTHDQAEALSLADLVGVMDAGRLLQIGSAPEVYARPNGLAVARLLGEGSELQAVTTSEGRVRSALGEHLPATGPRGPGACVLFARPEAVELCGSEGTGGIVRARRFFGHGWSVDVELEGGERLRLRTSAVAPQLAERVFVRVVGDVLAFDAPA